MGASRSTGTQPTKAARNDPKLACSLFPAPLVLHNFHHLKVAPLWVSTFFLPDCRMANRLARTCIHEAPLEKKTKEEKRKEEQKQTLAGMVTLGIRSSPTPYPMRAGQGRATRKIFDSRHRRPKRKTKRKRKSKRTDNSVGPLSSGLGQVPKV